jgi:beta-glucosidase
MLQRLGLAALCATFLVVIGQGVCAQDTTTGTASESRTSETAIADQPVTTAPPNAVPAATPAAIVEGATTATTTASEPAVKPEAKPDLPEVEEGAAYLNPALSPQERADDLIRRMTLDEKVSQMNNSAAAIPRLRVPEYDWWNECLHGVGIAGTATVFPQAIGLGATWNTELIHEVATATSDEARAKHHDALRNGNHGRFFGLTFWSPNINIFRDPRWGRGQETYGEDPYLTSRMGVNFVRGLQGDDPHYLKLVSTPKHYAVHSGPDPLRHKFDARIDQKNLYETYLPHFEACVREAGAFSIMCSYNRVNGEPACSNTELQEKILRDKWGFQGYIVSDCGAIDDIYKQHKVTATEAEAAARAVTNGCDLCCGSTYSALVEAAHKGLVSDKTLDQALKRLFVARFKLGMFDPPERVKYAQIPYSVVDSPEHRQLALRAARESLVLLKNDSHALPLRRDVKTIAVVGPNADEPEVLLGNYNGVPSARVTPLQGIVRKVGPGTRVLYAKGSAISEGEAVQPIPGSALIQPDSVPGRDAKHGLVGQYYNNRELSGDPITTRIDNKVDFDWKEKSPMRRVDKDLFSIRWRGKIVPPRTGDYQIGTRADDGTRLRVDGKTIVDDWSVHGAQTKTETVHLEEGKAVDVELEYFDERLNASVQLLWAPPAEHQVMQEEAVETAKKADVVVLVLGISGAIEGEEGDRKDIVLPKPQQELLEAITQLGKPTVLVLLNGGPVSSPYAQEHVPAILEAWYPGEEGGTAIADALFGDYNPGGRLPVTVYKSLDQVPAYEDYNMAAGRTYRYFQGEPLYPFGFGLSYTSFKYTGLKVSPASADGHSTVTVTATVANTGKVAGDEVAQLYLATDAKLPDAEDAPQPLRQLEGFTRVHLNPGEQKQVNFQLAPVQFSLVNNEGQSVVAPGKVHVSVGGGQPVAGGSAGNVLTGSFNVTGQPVVVKR